MGGRRRSQCAHTLSFSELATMHADRGALAPFRPVLQLYGLSTLAPVRAPSLSPPPLPFVC